MPELRAPSVTGVYELVVFQDDSLPHMRVARASLIVGFDSAAMAALKTAGSARDIFLPPPGVDSMRVQVRFCCVFLVGLCCFVFVLFLWLFVFDAAPLPMPPPDFPEAARAAGLGAGNVVLRFIVGRDGLPEPGTAEAVRATDMVFLRSALDHVSRQRFRPATIRGCPVAQVVDYSISFFAPDPPPH